MWYRLRWPDGRMEVLCSVPAARLGELHFLLAELRAEFEQCSQVEPALGGLLCRPWARTVAERCLGIVPLLGTEARLGLADFESCPELLQDLLLGDGSGEQLPELLRFHIEEANRYPLPADQEAASWTPLDTDAALLAGLASVLPDGMTGALALVESRSSGFICAFMQERRAQVDPKFREQKIFERAERLAEQVISDHRAELDRRYEAFMKGEDPHG